MNSGERILFVMVVAALLLSTVFITGCTDTGSDEDVEVKVSDLNFEWVYIPPGRFWMGVEDYEDETNSWIKEDSSPRHQVTISKGFEILKFEVTQSQWEAVMGSNPSSFSGDNNPVERVSWYDGQDFIDELNSLDPAHTYRLPTEAEWEYAARAGTDTKYSFGDDPAQLGQYAWYSDNSNSNTHPVGEKKPNGWALYDMTGNVWEWVRDWHNSDYYSNSPDKDPQGPDSGSNRVVRGGSWTTSADSCRSAYRSNPDPDFRGNFIGLRLVREA